MKILINFVNWIFTILGVIGVIGIILEIPMSIIFAVIFSKEKDEIKKKKIKKWGIIALLSPFILIISSLVLIIILQVTKAFIK